MKKTATDQQIVDLLKQGKSYTEIQSELSVSPSRISTIKKKYANEFHRPEPESVLQIPKTATEKTIEVIEKALSLNERSRGIVFRNLSLLLSGDENELARHKAEVLEFRRKRDLGLL
jgi:hypothetical protein